jgi:hypothetical protein
MLRARREISKNKAMLKSSMLNMYKCFLLNTKTQSQYDYLRPNFVQVLSAAAALAKCRHGNLFSLFFPKLRECA